jgi:hypothetical protein
MKLEFTQEQIADLKAALMELPFRIADPLVLHINNEMTRLYNEQYDKQRESAPADNHSV